MSRIIIACAISLAVGLATGLTLRPASSPQVAVEGLAPITDLAATPDSGNDSSRDRSAPRIRGSFHPQM